MSRRNNRSDDFWFADSKEPAQLNEPHAFQQRVIDIVNNPKYKRIVIVAGRRVGKSSVFANTTPALVDHAVYDGKRIGFFSPVAVDVKPVYDALKKNYRDFVFTKNEQERWFEYDSSGFIKFWSMPNKGGQESGRGDNYYLTIYEEAQKFIEEVLQHHYTQVATPWTFDTPGSKIIFNGTANAKRSVLHGLAQRGVKSGLAEKVIHNNYISDLTDGGQVVDGYEDWITIRMPTELNPYLDAEAVAAERAKMDSVTARQELDCIFVDIIGASWLYAAKDEAIQRRVFVDTLDVNWRERIYLSFDFNKAPMSCILFQIPAFRPGMTSRTWKRGIHYIKEFKTPDAEKSSIYDLCRIIRNWIYGETGKRITERQRFPFPVMVTGDATGKHGDGRQKVSRGYFEIICDELGISSRTQLRLETTNPPHADSYVQMNTLFEANPFLQISRKGCPQFCQDIDFTIADIYKGIDKKKYDPHMLDAGRYAVNTFRKELSKVF